MLQDGSMISDFDTRQWEVSMCRSAASLLWVLLLGFDSVLPRHLAYLLWAGRRSQMGVLS